MLVTINLDTNHPADLETLQRMFGSVVPCITPAANPNPAAEPAATTEPAKTTRTRKATKKEESPATETPAPATTTAPATVAQAGVEVSTPDVGASVTPPAPVQSAEAVDPFGASPPTQPAATPPATPPAQPAATGGTDLELVRKRVLAVAQKVDAKIVTDKLEALTGVRRANDIPPAKFDEVLAMLASLEAAADLAG